MEEKLIAYSILSGNGCWEWQGGKAGNGYGIVCIGHQKQKYAHRMSYGTFIGEIPKGLVVMHSCDNPCCINPLHLSVGTHKENSQDMSRKGRCNMPSSKGFKNPRCKLTEKQIKTIKTLEGTHVSIAKMFGVSNVLIGLIRNGKLWCDIG